VRTTNKWTRAKQYGQPGFVGEPINLNVVNADIRDILNYITEQYGVNFVIDNSVGAIPVTGKRVGRAMEYCFGRCAEGQQVGN
jgi:type IV pilus assembly protein PilQ